MRRGELAAGHLRLDQLLKRVTVLVRQLADLDTRAFAHQRLGELQLPVGDRCVRGCLGP
ncbi:hypothetical protein ACFRLW_30390 [Streptomyces sp. NPDC056728]